MVDPETEGKNKGTESKNNRPRFVKQAEQIRTEKKLPVMITIDAHFQEAACHSNSYIHLGGSSQLVSG